MTVDRNPLRERAQAWICVPPLGLAEAPDPAFGATLTGHEMVVIRGYLWLRIGGAIPITSRGSSTVSSTGQHRHFPLTSRTPSGARRPGPWRLVRRWSQCDRLAFEPTTSPRVRMFASWTRPART